MITRRQCLAALAATPLVACARHNELPPIRTVTRGPKFHWFGYYDKLQFDPSSRLLLGMEVDFEHRSPRGDDPINIGMVDLGDGDRWIELGTSKAWGWQQGCMLQWLPGSKTDVIWNDREGNQFVCRRMDVVTRRMTTLPRAIYAVTPDARFAVTVDFRRLNDVRPGYGYAGPPDPHREVLAPRDAGIWKVDLATGRDSLILSLAEVLLAGKPTGDWATAKHWFNHLLVNPDGSRFVFLHRWRPQGMGKGFRTRMLTATLDGKDLHVVDPSGYTSHFIWRDPAHLVAWTRPALKPDGFYVFTDKTDQVEPIGAGIMTVNGHNTYLPGNRWILNDTYPDKARLQHPYLYEVATGRKVPLGHFHSPREYADEWRCDTHPRYSPHGKLVCIDSPHTGQGRQMHVIDIANIVKDG
jgi:hypothetical protein